MKNEQSKELAVENAIKKAKDHLADKQQCGNNEFGKLVLMFLGDTGFSIYRKENNK